MLKKNIYLIGPMGSGKSSVGKQLEKLTGTPFIDSDAEIEKRTGVSISWIFEKETESGFRQRESDIIAKLTQLHNVIIGTGGGSILMEKNRHHLSSNGTIIYLKVSLNIQVKRVQQKKGLRPLLNQADIKKKLDTLNKSRRVIYESLANFTINTDNKTPLEVAKIIIQQMKG